MYPSNFRVRPARREAESIVSPRLMKHRDITQNRPAGFCALSPDYDSYALSYFAQSKINSCSRLDRKAFTNG